MNIFNKILSKNNLSTLYIYKYLLYIIIFLIMTHCIMQDQIKDNINTSSVYNKTQQLNYNSNQQTNSNTLYDHCIYRYAKNYGIDADLIKAIIKVESNYNPSVISKSNAVGLMQLKADTAGKDAYRLKGWNGKPSVCDLKNAVINIELGTAYLSILQKQLEGILNIKTRRYAIIVAYVNGLGALLKVFSEDRICAIEKINSLNPDQFCQYIKHHHPSKQAQRYLFKVNAAYVLNH